MKLIKNIIRGMKMNIQFLMISFFFLCCFNMNINNSFGEIAYHIADSMINMPTIILDGVKMLNYLLYGHTDLPYNYSDFLHHFGEKVKIGSFGHLIIGNDEMLGGLLLDEIIFLKAAIPYNGHIIKIGHSEFKDYFPNGYSIIRSPSTFYTPYSGFGDVLLKYGNLCLGCYCFLNVGSKNTTNFEENNVVNIEIRGHSFISISIYGYVQHFDPSLNIGTINVSSYSVDLPNITTLYHYANDFFDNSLSLQINADNSVYFKGNLYMIYNQTEQFLNFNLSLVPRHHMQHMNVE